MHHVLQQMISIGMLMLLLYPSSVFWLIVLKLEADFRQTNRVLHWYEIHCTNWACYYVFSLLLFGTIANLKETTIVPCGIFWLGIHEDMLYSPRQNGL